MGRVLLLAVVLAACERGSALTTSPRARVAGLRAPPARPRARVAGSLRAAAGGASADDEARVLALLGEGRVVLGAAEAAELDALLAALAAAAPAPTAAALDGDWKLLYTSKSSFDRANPLGRRVDGSTPGLEGLLPGARDAAAAASSS